LNSFIFFHLAMLHLHVCLGLADNLFFVFVFFYEVLDVFGASVE